MDTKENIFAEWDPTAARNSAQMDRGSTRSVQMDGARASATSMFTRMSLAQGTQSLPTQTALEVMMMLTENLKNDDGESSLESTDEHGGESLPGAREFRKSRSMFDVLDQRGRDGSQASSPRKICRQLSNNMNVVIFLAFVTVWVLFSDDLRFACMPARADPAMGWISIVCMCIFLLEIIMYSLASRSYVGSFFFWLDILATASMIFDIPAVEDAIFNLLNGDSTTLESAALARATRTSRVGTKAGRIASAVRVMRLVRVVKLFKHVESRNEDDGRRKRSRTSMLAPQVQQSRVGQKLSELTTRRVVLGVLTMVFVLPYWDIANGVYGGSPNFEDVGLLTLHNQALLNNTGPVFTQALDDYKSGVRYYLGAKKTSQLLYLSVANVTYVPQSPVAETLRSREVHVVEEKTAGCNPGSQDDCLVSGSMLSRKWDSRLDSILQMCKTIFILIVLGGGALLFSADANRLVLIPVDRMVQRVKNMADNPRSFTKAQSVAGQAPYQDTSLQAADTEMRILEASIDKISELLAVAFGDAGVDIIAENMRCMGGLDPMVPGQRTVAIFGFCDIRNFTDLTEVLQEGVMSFVNTVAQIVHSEVHLHDGAANKNIGDAFLLVWKFRDGFTAKHLRGLLKAFKTGSGPEPSSAGGIRMGRSIAGSMDSVSGMPGYDSIESSIRNVDSEDASTSISSPKHLSTQQSKRGYHMPTISWGDLGQQSCPKPLQILPTHLSIPETYLTPSSLEPFTENLPATSVASAAVAPMPLNVADDSNPVDIAHVEPSLASEEGAATHGPGRGASTLGNGDKERDSILIQKDSVLAHDGSMIDHGASMIEREGSIIEHGGSVIEHEGSMIVHEDSVIVHEDSIIVHDDSRLPDDGEGQPVGEGFDGASSSSSIPERSSGVSFSPEPRRNLHRHKSSNYSRLLDYRLDEWLPRESDPLNIPEDLRESAEGLRSALTSRSGVSAMSFSESKLDNIAMQRRTKRANSNEIMAMLPDKLRTQAEHAQSLADSALNSFVIVNAALQRSAALSDYVTRQDVKKRMGNDFRVGMGFGLHAGWSIEGAIGSKHKVDASYLSPNVNMAARLESATKQYGVAILMSADFTALLSSAMRAKCRQIDTVLVKGSSQPMGIWTIDTDTRWITADVASSGGGWSDPSMYVHNSKTDADRTSTLDEFEKHQDIIQSYCGSEEFLEKWKAGFNHYKSGAWQEARALLEETYTMRRDVEGNVVRDTPSKVLMDFMAKTQFCAPGDWSGHRELTEK